MKNAHTTISLTEEKFKKLAKKIQTSLSGDDKKLTQVHELLAQAFGFKNLHAIQIAFSKAGETINSKPNAPHANGSGATSSLDLDLVFQLAEAAADERRMLLTDLDRLLIQLGVQQIHSKKLPTTFTSLQNVLIDIMRTTDKNDIELLLGTTDTDVRAKFLTQWHKDSLETNPMRFSSGIASGSYATMWRATGLFDHLAHAEARNFEVFHTSWFKQMHLKNGIFQILPHPKIPATLVSSSWLAIEAFEACFSSFCRREIPWFASYASAVDTLNSLYEDSDVDLPNLTIPEFEKAAWLELTTTASWPASNFSVDMVDLAKQSLLGNAYERGNAKTVYDFICSAINSNRRKSAAISDLING